MRFVLVALALILSAPVLVRAADWTPTKLPAAQTEANPKAPTWLRCYVRVPADMTTPQEKDLFRDSVTMTFADIAGPYSIYLNGKKIGDGDGIAVGELRRIKVPKDILVAKAFNALAVRLDPKAAQKGMPKPPVISGYFVELAIGPGWEVQREEVDPATLTALAKQPANAAYTEAVFHPASSPLARSTQAMPGKKLPPAESLAKMKTADDLAVDLLLNEPQVAQPTHISFDERGRMWVAQYRQYPYPAGVKQISRDMYYRSVYDKAPPAPPHNDKGADIISVEEDTDGDGKFDKHTVVLDGLNMANAVVRGHGGIWVMNTPYLMFYPDANGDDVPDRDPEVRLAGFGLEDTHSVANGLAWGPDGWLYGMQGSTTTSRITRPGVDPPGAPGVYYESCMVWRYHPEKKIYEIFADGGGNNFGLEFDAEGRLFGGHNGGTTRGFYFVQSGIYLKQGADAGKFGPPTNPYSFGELPQMATRNEIPRFTHHLSVFEGTALPEKYIGRIFGADPLHNNLTLSERYAKGSTFETGDDAPPLSSSDVAFRPVFLANAPDGSLYVADFYEEFIAHGQNYQGQIDNTTGRIFRLRGKDAKLISDVNLSTKSTEELVQTLSHLNRWHRQTAVRMLGERRAPQAIDPLKKLLAAPAVHPALEALWALYQMGALDEATALFAISHPAPAVRAWAVRLLGVAKQFSPTVDSAVRQRATTESDPVVRCQLASTARRLSAAQALPLVSALVARDADATDVFIPLLCWWTIESHCDANRDAVVELFKDPAAWNPAVVRGTILPRLMKRFAAKGTHGDYLACAALLDRAPTDAHRKLLMTGFEEAVKGKALSALPTELVTALAKSGLASPVLKVRLGDAAAIAATLKMAGDATAKVEERYAGISVFGEVKVPEAVAVLLNIAHADANAELRKAALASLMSYDDASIGTQVAGFYAELPADVRPSAANLLASRPAWAEGLFKAIESGKVKGTEVSAEVVARLQGDEDAVVAQRAQKVFGAAATKPALKPATVAEIQRVRKVLEKEPGDPYKGEAVFLQRCASCHTLFFKGGKIGPNLTPYQRDDFTTLLPSIIDPSAEIREGFQSYLLRTKDGRTLSGFLTDSDSTVLAIRGTDGQDVRVPKANVVKLKPMTTSLMPEGLLQGLDDPQLRDFFAYLRIPQPITR